MFIRGLILRIQAKGEEDETHARAGIVHSRVLGNTKGVEAFKDWPYFDGYLCHKSFMSELCVWSMGHVHGIQCTFLREGKKGGKAEKHATELGKQMPTANAQTLAIGEEIMEIAVIVSKQLVPGVIGQITVKTTNSPSEGYRFGRTTDGDETALVTPEGMRVLCLHGSYGDQGLRELGVTYVPKMQRKGKHPAQERPFTACSRAKVSLIASDGLVLTISSDTGRLHSIKADKCPEESVFTLDGEGGEIAFRTTKKGQYLSVEDSGDVVCRWSGWALTRRELFEVEKHATDDGDKLSFRAYNGRSVSIKRTLLNLGLTDSDFKGFCICSEVTDGF